MTKAEIMELIEQEDVEFIRLQFSDIFGNLKNLAVTPGQMDKVFANKYSFEGSAMFSGYYDSDIKLYLYPDINTFSILPWRPQQGKVAKIICDVCYEDGRPYEISSRCILKRVIEDAKKKGYTFMVDPECEFFLFHTDEHGMPTTTTHELAGYMDVGPMDFGENARRDIVLMLEEMGFEIESSHHEHAPAQHEIDFKEEEALKMADSIQTFRFAVRSIAKRFGLYATFMPKPKNGCAGSSMHINISMLKDGKNLFRSEDNSITKEADYFMGGILKHAKALCAISNPVVNSYKRLASGFEAPGVISWATKGEKALVKLNAGLDDTKVELRFPDSASNPYLLIATCIAAGLDGIENMYSAGNEYDSSVNKYEALPDNIKEAVDKLNEDDVIKNVLGKEFTEVYSIIKRNAWTEYMTEVSDWELNRYLIKM